MPCHRCAARQTDPVRGASPWKRGVVAGQQVLVCPACQNVPDVAQLFDRCERCGSTHLAKALGAVHCRDCGAESWPEQASVAAVAAAPAPAGVFAPAGVAAAGASRPPSDAGLTLGALPAQAPVPSKLADEVAAALERVLRHQDRP
jgi:hypothetical protein